MKELVYGDKKLSVEKIGDTLWVHVDGDVMTYKPVRRTRSGGGAQALTNEIVAPMPGKIIKLMKSSGDSTAAGDVIIVMEAMKMEYSLKAPVSGILEALAVAAGDQVTLGQKLARVQPVEGDKK